MTDHVSDLQWDRLLAGELALDLFSAAHAHADGCEACAARLRALTAERDAFNEHPFALPPPRARRRWIVPLVAAAATVVIAVRLAPWPGPDEPRARSKGIVQTMAEGGARLASHAAPVLLLTAGQPDALTSVSTGDVIHPGEYLQAGYTAARDGFGAVLSRDGAGAVNAYVPPGGADMVALPAGTARSFPHSTILDGALGSERIAVVWCATAHPLEPLLAALRAREELRVPDDCMAREVVLDKRGLAGGPSE